MYWQKLTPVGRAVASVFRGPQFVSSHRQKNYFEHLFIVNCIEKTKVKKKRPGMAHFKKITPPPKYKNEFGNTFLILICVKIL